MDDGSKVVLRRRTGHMEYWAAHKGIVMSHTKLNQQAAVTIEQAD